VRRDDDDRVRTEIGRALAEADRRPGGLAACARDEELRAGDLGAASR
jgi:hypothetical protein